MNTKRSIERDIGRRKRIMSILFFLILYLFLVYVAAYCSWGRGFLAPIISATPSHWRFPAEDRPEPPAKTVASASTVCSRCSRGLNAHKEPFHV